MPVNDIHEHLTHIHHLKRDTHTHLLTTHTHTHTSQKGHTRASIIKTHTHFKRVWPQADCVNCALIVMCNIANVREKADGVIRNDAKWEGQEELTHTSNQPKTQVQNVLMR